MDDRDIPGVWNAYVEAGKTPEQRRARLDEVPESMRASVEAHVRTVFGIRKGRVRRAA